MKSMTGYAALDRPGRRWELRGVNGRGLDMRLRLPDRPQGLEPAARKALGATLARGNVTLSLRLGAEGREATIPRLSHAALDAALDAAAEVAAAAAERGLDMRAPGAADILALRGIWEAGEADEPPALDTLTAELTGLIAEFDAARAAEGEALATLLTGHVD